MQLGSTKTSALLPVHQLFVLSQPAAWLATQWAGSKLSYQDGRHDDAL